MMRDRMKVAAANKRTRKKVDASRKKATAKARANLQGYRGRR